MTIDVLLVDDHDLVRESLSERLNRESDLRVVGTCGNANDAIPSARDLQPSIILMDIDMPGRSCFDAARRILTAQPKIGLIFLSAHVRDNYVKQASEVGARGYLTKGCPPEEVVSAIRTVNEGALYFCEEVQARWSSQENGDGVATSRLSTLTKREMEILIYIARGLAKKEIAGIMTISVKTVEKHTENVMRKLDIHDRVELCRFALRDGLLPP